MQTRQWTEEHIIALLQQANRGETPIADLCRTRGMSENTFDKWRTK